MAFGYCEAVYNCPCESYPYPNFNECLADLSIAYDAINDEAFIAGLSYDGSCPAQELNEIEALACKGSVAGLPAGVCVPPCNAWHGPHGAGSICEVVASSPELGLGFSNCAQGLTCLAGVCVNPCQVGQLPGIGQPCPDLVCAAGAMCDASQVCVAMPTLPGPAETCLNNLCDPTRAVCVIEANVCAALPTVGQACVQGQCDPSSYCGIDDVCVARPPLVCGLIVGNPGDGDGDGDGDPTGDGDGDGDGDPGDCSATPLSNTLPVLINGDTFSAPSADNGTCGGGGPEQSYTFVAPSSGIYYVSLEGSDYDTVLYVRDGDCTGAELACADDTIETTSALEVALAADQEVTIFVDGYDGPGNFVLQISLF
jgi:hypothetical protein